MNEMNAGEEVAVLDYRGRLLRIRPIERTTASSVWVDGDRYSMSTRREVPRTRASREIRHATDADRIKLRVRDMRHDLEAHIPTMPAAHVIEIHAAWQRVAPPQAVASTGSGRPDSPIQSSGSPAIQSFGSCPGVGVGGGE